VAFDKASNLARKAITAALRSDMVLVQGRAIRGDIQSVMRSR
jgi:hypothetical protein